MAQFKIPSDLVSMVSARRVIPFIGAGFSSPLKMPNWEQLLSKLASDMGDRLSFKEVNDYCNGDLLQVAEYYFLRCDKSIGPLRHAIQSILQSESNTILSSPYHVDLVNLGTPQVYTTNFDDFIENTFQSLSRPFEVVSLPKHVATSDGRKTQIVKYHGDLRYESTLVLTESSYYSRLDFESPMDLKFRSDLLGRSVLFMGYSFRDINIRIIWFKLIKMMKDIPPADRPISYIVRFEPNPVLEKLYMDVGIETIVLDPSNSASSEKERTDLFSEFMLELACRSSVDMKIPGTNDSMYLSKSIIDRIRQRLDDARSKKIRVRGKIAEELRSYLHHAANCKIIPLLESTLDELLIDVASVVSFQDVRAAYAELALTLARQSGPSRGVTFAIAKGLSRGPSREVILMEDTPWDTIWNNKLKIEDVNQILNEFEKEISAHEQHDEYFDFDADIAYLADLAKRIEFGYIVDEKDEASRERAKSLLRKASDIYTSVVKLEINPKGEPTPSEIIEEIEDKRSEEDVPF